MSVHVHVHVRVRVCVRVYKLSGIRSVRYRTEKTHAAGTGLVPDQAKVVRHFLVWYWIGIIDAGMPIPELVPSMPMPSYDCKYHNFYGARARMCVDTLHLFRKLIGRRAPFSSAAGILICATATVTHFPPYSGLIFLANYFFTTALLHCPSSSYLHPLLSHNLTCSMLPALQLQWPFASLPIVLHCVTAPTYCLTACPLLSH